MGPPSRRGDVRRAPARAHAAMVGPSRAHLRPRRGRGPAPGRRPRRSAGGPCPSGPAGRPNGSPSSPPGGQGSRSNAPRLRRPRSRSPTTGRMDRRLRVDRAPHRPRIDGRAVEPARGLGPRALRRGARRRRAAVRCDEAPAGRSCPKHRDCAPGAGGGGPAVPPDLGRSGRSRATARGREPEKAPRGPSVSRMPTVAGRHRLARLGGERRGRATRP